MNIEQANRIPMPKILEILEVKLIRETQTRKTYLSPFSEGKHASLHVNLEKNTWYDHRLQLGGDMIAFAFHYLHLNDENHTVADCLRWLKNLSTEAVVIQNIANDLLPPDANKLVLRSVKLLQDVGLYYCLKNRGIDLNHAYEVLKQVRVYNPDTRKAFNCFGMVNEEEGFHLQNFFFNGSVGEKAISFMRGAKPKPEGIHLFACLMDYLTFLTIKGQHDDDAIIFHSLDLMRQATPYIKGYGYSSLYSWMTNDVIGKLATASIDDFCKSEPGLKHRQMNDVYLPCKSLNAFHMTNLNLNFKPRE